MSYGFYSTCVLIIIAYLSGLARQTSLRIRYTRDEQQYLPNVMILYPINFWFYGFMSLVFGIYEMLGCVFGYHGKNINRYYGHFNNIYQFGDLPPVIMGAPLVLILYPLALYFITVFNYTASLNEPDYLIMILCLFGYLFVFNISADVCYTENCVYCIENKIKHNRKN